MIGLRMKKERENAGISRDVMASRIHMKKTNYNKIECEDRLPNLEQLLIFCKEMGVSSDYLLGLGN